jgi:glucosamine kinase
MAGANYVLAVDGGGSKTAIALLNASGEELARCAVGPSNLYRRPGEGLSEILRGWHLACARAGLCVDETGARTTVSAGLAGITGVAQRRAFMHALDGFVARRLSSDGYTSFAGTFGAGPGALLMIGTGVVAYRRDAGAAPQPRAGWGFPVGDRGGGAWLGLRLVTEYLDQLDGATFDPGSTLWAVAEGWLGRDRATILRRLRPARAAEFAALARAIVAAATQGDRLGSTLLDEGGRHLARLARALAPSAAVPLALGGGLADAYRPRLATLLPASLLLSDVRPDPLRGAFLIATGAVAPEYGDVS